MKSPYQANITQIVEVVGIFRENMGRIVYEKEELLKYYTNMLSREWV